MAADMTKGSIKPQLVKFTIPLVLGNLFQLTYNAIDAIVVGKYVGDNALAAVGTAGPIMNLAILFVSGMCMGASILISTCYGAKQFEKMQRQISTTLLGGLVFAVILSILMMFLARLVLLLIRVPQDIMQDATGYLRIIFLGLVFTFIYNFFSNTLRALGDSKTPLYFLIISAVLNGVGDIVFVVLLKQGVQGSAVATVLSEMLCCLSCGLYIKFHVPLLSLGKKWLVLDFGLLRNTVTYGITSALQQMCVQLGKVLVQIIVNTQGVAFIAAFAVINRVDDFIMTPQQNIAHAMTTFIAQNRGAGKQDRMKQGFKSGMLIEMVYSVVFLVLVFIFAKPITEIFVGKDSTEVVALSTSYLKLIAFMYLIPGITNGVQGYFRGIGDLKVTLASTMMNMGARAAAAFVFIQLLSWHFNGLAWANMVGWFVMMLFELPLLFKSIKRMRKV